jgi:hypothetical protein
MINLAEEAGAEFFLIRKYDLERGHFAYGWIWKRDLGRKKYDIVLALTEHFQELM